MALHLTPEEAGAIDFPDVGELLDYWAEYPPEHLLLRAMAHYEGRKDRSNWQKERATQMGDDSYVAEEENKEKTVFSKRKDISIVTAEEKRLALEAFTGGRHLDCAPTHIQEAVTRTKQGKHMEIPKPG